MKVICAGYSKTGTKTMAAVLTSFGYKIYDFEEHFMLCKDQYERIFNGEPAVPIFKEMLKDVDAIMDMPGYLYWEQIAEAFPEAKVILVERDENKWVESLIGMFKIIDDRRWFSQTIAYAMRPLLWFLSPTLIQIRPWCDRVFTLAFGPGADKHTSLMSRDYMLKLYRSHNAHVIQNCPAEKLLRYKMGDGWAPICEILGEPVPSDDFPHSNKKGSIVDDLMNSQSPYSARKQIEKEFNSRMCVYVALGAVYWLFRGQIKSAANNVLENAMSFGLA